jgi:hypothetical protein
MLCEAKQHKNCSARAKFGKIALLFAVEIDSSNLAPREMRVEPTGFVFMFAPLRMVYFTVIARLSIVPIVESGSSLLKCTNAVTDT